jgi:hypothetical protein
MGKIGGRDSKNALYCSFCGKRCASEVSRNLIRVWVERLEAGGSMMMPERAINFQEYKSRMADFICGCVFFIRYLYCPPVVLPHFLSITSATFSTVLV